MADPSIQITLQATGHTASWDGAHSWQSWTRCGASSSPALAVAPAQAAPAAIPAFSTPREAADAALTYALERRPEGPEFFTCTIRRQEGRVVTSDTLEGAIRAAQVDRQSRVTLEALAVGLVGADVGGVTLLVEGVRRLG